MFDRFLLWVPSRFLSSSYRNSLSPQTFWRCFFVNCLLKPSTLARNQPGKDTPHEATIPWTTCTPKKLNMLVGREKSLALFSVLIYLITLWISLFLLWVFSCFISLFSGKFYCSKTQHLLVKILSLLKKPLAIAKSNQQLPKKPTLMKPPYPLNNCLFNNFHFIPRSLHMEETIPSSVTNFLLSPCQENPSPQLIPFICIIRVKVWRVVYSKNTLWLLYWQCTV